MKVTDFFVKNSKGNKINADPYGNNIGFSCFYCSYPMLVIVRKHHRGSCEDKPSVCRGCYARHFVKDADRIKKEVVIDGITHDEIVQNKMPALRRYPLKREILCFLAGALVVAFGCFLFSMY